jgi:hypothetical protein
MEDLCPEGAQKSYWPAGIELLARGFCRRAANAGAGWAGLGWAKLSPAVHTGSGHCAEPGDVFVAASGTVFNPNLPGCDVPANVMDCPYAPGKASVSRA